MTSIGFYFYIIPVVRKYIIVVLPIHPQHISQLGQSFQVDMVCEITSLVYNGL